ncbi:hypothetical protein MTR67_027708 [Solanum verrucosum]|uniref:Uncharacterized protein n=1 Tax=Solanum verrucosum TaxID=315347 RepID=A0AAF0R565_SOLVR|nr:hypothetical protein MTR67_027708 [Solanum verrucosum]
MGHSGRDLAIGLLHSICLYHVEAFVKYVSAELLPLPCSISTTTPEHAVVYSWDSVVELPGTARIGTGAIIISSLLPTCLSVRLIWSGLTGKIN